MITRSDSNMRKILFVIPRMGGGGAERVVSILANHLCKKGYYVRIITFVSDESFYELDKKIEFQSALFVVDRKTAISAYVSMGKSFVKAIKYVKDNINSFKPDMVFSVLVEADIVTYLANRGKNKGVHICSERNDPTRRNHLIQSCVSYIYSRVDAFVCQSKTISTYYRHTPESKKCVIPNPIDLSNIPTPVPECRPLKIVAVGRLSKQKNFKLLVESFASVVSRIDNVSLVIFGEGPERTNLESLLKQLELENKVFLPGTTKNILLEINDAAIFVMSSDYEGFPNALIEAIASGIPVISTDFASGVAKEIVVENVGLLIPVGDKVSLTRAMLSLLHDDEYRNKIRETCKNEVSQFDVQFVISKWVNLFSSLLGESS